MNIIFLDMDGVVNSKNTFKKAHEDGAFLDLCLENRSQPFLIDPTLRDRIIDIIEKVPNCKVVWSSTWRLGLRNSKVFIEGFYNKCGFPEGSFCSFTPHLGGFPRYVEIAQWLKVFGEKNKVDKCVIIDDDFDAYISTSNIQSQVQPIALNQDLKDVWIKYNPQFFKTEFENGITEEIKNKILVYFLNSNVIL